MAMYGSSSWKRLRSCHWSTWFQIYGRKVRLKKDPRFYQTQALGLQHSLPYTCDLSDHRHLRSVYEKYWTKSGVLDKESMIWSKVELFCKQLAKRSLDGREICLHNAFRKVAVDIATEFAWNKSLGWVDFCLTRNYGWTETQRNRKRCGFNYHNQAARIVWLLSDCLSFPGADKVYGMGKWTTH